MKIKLNIISETGKSFTLELAGKELYNIGRSQCDIKLTEPKCSRSHAILYLEDTRFLTLRDLDSTNGTVVDDEKITEGKRLAPGSSFRIGSTLIQVLTFAPAENEDPSTETNVSPLKPGELMKGWPDNYRALPQDNLEKYVDYIDPNIRKKSVRLIDIDKKKKKKA